MVIDVTHKGLVDAVQKLLPSTLCIKGRFETLQQQCLSLLAVQHPICCAERVPQMRHICVPLESQPQGKWHSVTHK